MVELVASGRRAGSKTTINTNSSAFTMLLGLLAALPALSIDINAPTLSILPQVLATSEAVAGLTLSVFLGGFAIGQFAGGIWSDRYGRKPVLLTGCLIYSAGSIACALALSGLGMVAFRLVQGIGAGTCAALSFAIVQDLFRGAAARSKRAYVTMILGAAPIIAPALGSIIFDFAGWRAIYIVLASGGLVLLAVLWRWLAESRPVQKQALVKRPNSPELLVQDKQFVSVALVNALSYGVVFAYIAGSPLVVMNYYHGTTRSYAALFACTAVALSAGAWTSGRLGRRGVPANTLVSVVLTASTAASLVLAVSCFAGPTVSGPIAVCLLAFIQFCRGMIAPNLQHLAIDRQSQRAGTASAAVGVSQLIGGVLSSVAVANLLAGFGPFAVAGPMALFSIAALVVWQWRVLGGLSLKSCTHLFRVPD